jgi:chlorophyllase
MQEVPCPEEITQATTSPIESEPVFRDSTDPYALGALAVETISVKRCQEAAPAAMLIHTPAEVGTYPVVVFQHGFLAYNSEYNEILTRLASHGFIVVAPQMYEPGLGALTGHPSAAQEADLAGRVLDWLPAHLASFVGYAARTDLIGLAGHSRGGRVAWLVLLSDPSRAKAVAGVDPVDGDRSPFGDPTRIIRGPFNFSFPSLIIGAALSGDCAPAGANHEQFYAASASPAWHVVATDYGHTDMLDEDEANVASEFCRSGRPDRENMRRLVAGLLTAFFRGALQDDPDAFSVLTAADAAPARITTESK